MRRLILRNVKPAQACYRSVHDLGGTRMPRDKIKNLRRRVYLVLEQGPVGDLEWRQRLAKGVYDIHGYGVYQLDPSATSPTKLKSLVDALNALQVPTADVIDIIKALERNGAVYGRVIVE